MKNISLADCVMYSGSVYSGLGDLLLLFCQAKQINIPDKLLEIQHLNRFEYTIWRELLDNLALRWQQPALSLHLMQYLQPKHAGILTYMIQPCRNLQEVLERYSTFHQLIYDGSPLIIQKNQHEVTIRWDVPKQYSSQYTSEIAVALMYKFLTHTLAIQGMKFNQIEFMHLAPKDSTIYQDFFHCDAIFDSEFTQISFPYELLNQPIQGIDQTIQALLMEQAIALLEDSSRNNQMDRQLQHAILLAIQKNQCSIENIAKQMDMSVRKLQYHLQQQDMTFQYRVQNIKLMLAQYYLKDKQLHLLEIALLLGYAEQSVFQRAFKQWTGKTPSQWRKLAQ